MKKRGKSAEWIENKRKEVKPNCRVKDIRWGCDDPTEYSFTVPGRAPDQPPELQGEGADAEAPPPPPPITHTVASYYLEAYGIRLRYPKMPLIKVGRIRIRGQFTDLWFPIEFFTQAFGKTRDADNQKLTAALQFNDEKAGRESVERITDMVRVASRLERNGLTLGDYLNRFGVEFGVEPEAFDGRVESEPKLHFSGHNQASVQASVNNGDWRLAERRVAHVFAWYVQITKTLCVPLYWDQVYHSRHSQCMASRSFFNFFAHGAAPVVRQKSIPLLW